MFDTGGCLPQFAPVISGVPGDKTLLNFLKTAIMPVGTTLYIYGGGWDLKDKGSNVQTMTIGVSPDWVRFFNEHDGSFNYKDAECPKNGRFCGGYNEYRQAGLDCSGYVGWVLYNTLETENMRAGYVAASTGMAKGLAEKGLGKWSRDITGITPGEIISIKGHVWISLGVCSDKSALILHSTPSKSRTDQPGGGVQMSAVGRSKACEAYDLADRYMSEYFPEWYRRYPIYLCDPDVYFLLKDNTAGKFTWSYEVLSDIENVGDMTPEEVLSVIFEKKM